MGMILSDDDEYIYIKDPSKKMLDIRDYMEQKRVCSLGIRWRMFGSSYHDYPPPAGSYISNYFWRGPLFSEATNTTRNKMMTDKAKYVLNDPFFGKSIRLLANTTTDRCGNHLCTECSTVGMHSCAPFESHSKPGRPPVTGYCRNLDIDERILISDKNLQIMHFGYESSREWHEKMKRFGGTRSQTVPPEYDSVFDDRLARSTEERLSKLRNTELAACLNSALLGADFKKM